MKCSEQCRIAASKCNQVLGMIRRNITYKEKSLIVPLYKAIVRPHLEYCIQAWSPLLLLNACVRVADVMIFTFVSLMPVHNVCRICMIIKQ